MNSLCWLTSLLAVQHAIAAVIVPRHVEERSLLLLEATTSSLISLADELFVDHLCLTLANPLWFLPNHGHQINVPVDCCGLSCQGPLCSQQEKCKPQNAPSSWPSASWISAPWTSAPWGYPTATVTVVVTTSLGTTTSTSATSTSKTSSTSLTLSTTSSSSSTTTKKTTTKKTTTSKTTTSSSKKSRTTSATQTTTTNSLGQTVISGSGGAVTLPTGLSSATTITTNGGTFTFTPGTSASSITTTNSLGQTVISGSGGVITVPTGLSSATTITSNGQTLTFVPTSPASSITTINSLGQTVISGSGGAVTVPTGITTPTVITSNGQTLTFSPSPGTAGSTSALTTTNSLGQTVISGSSGAITLPTGLSTATTLTSNGQTFTFSPTSPTGGSTQALTTTNSLGQTVISGSSGVITLPTGLSTATTLTSNGQTFTFSPSPSGGSTQALTTTNSLGQTVISGSSGVVTLPTGLSTATTLTSNGQTITFFPPVGTTTTNSLGQTVVATGSETFTIPTGLTAATTVTNSDGSVLTFLPPGATTTSSTTPASPVGIRTSVNTAGLTILSESGQAFTLPTGICAPTTLTGSDGLLVPFTPTACATTTSSTSYPAGFLYPFFTDVPDPKPSDTGTNIHCDVWFFFICITWPDINLKIPGWHLELPPGPHPPGPPPPIDFPKISGIEFSVTGTLPPWPEYTIGPDHIMTYSSKPDDCTTESATICLSSTSYGVSGTKTTTSSVTSSCGTVYGCKVTDSSTAITTTSSTAPACSASAIAGLPDWVLSYTSWSTTYRTTATTTSPTTSSTTSITSLASVASRTGYTCVSSVTTSDCVVGPPCGAPTVTCASWSATTTAPIKTSAGSTCVSSTLVPGCTTADTCPPPSQSCVSYAATTTAPITSVAGSTCVASTVVTKGGSPSQSCVSFVALTTLPPASSSGSTCVSSQLVTASGTPSQSCVSYTATLTPQTPSPVVCYDEKTEPGHADISEGDQSNFVRIFCQVDHSTDTITPTSGAVEEVHTDIHGTNYRYRVAWIPGCVMKDMKPSIYEPIASNLDGGPDCVTWMEENYGNCNNGGIGGYTDVGCVRYEFVGGLGAGVPVPAADNWL